MFAGTTNELHNSLFASKWDEDASKYVPDTDSPLFPGVTVSVWGDVYFGDDVTEDTLKTFARHAASLARSAQNVSDRHERRYDSLHQNVEADLRTIGAISREAAIAQGWCGEYEQYISRMTENLLTFPGILSEAADRRAEFTVTLTVRARNASAAQDFVYSVAANNDESQRYAHTYAEVTASNFEQVSSTPVAEDSDY